MSFIAGGAYALVDRIRHLQLRHHRDRADATCFDYKAFLRRRPVAACVDGLEWAHLPAVEAVMQLQVMCCSCPASAATCRGSNVGPAHGVARRFSLKAALLYFVAYAVPPATLDFFDAFHHTFDQYFIDADAPVPMGDRDRNYEQAKHLLDVVSVSHPWLNLLTLNFGYHNAHHERASVPWYRLAALHRECSAAARVS